MNNSGATVTRHWALNVIRGMVIASTVIMAVISAINNKDIVHKMVLFRLYSAYTEDKQIQDIALLNSHLATIMSSPTYLE